MALSSFQRPISRGANRRGVPVWEGRELKLYRRAMGVRQTDLARRLSTQYERTRNPVALRPGSVDKYLDAVERDAAWNERDAADAAAELSALQTALGSKAAGR